MKKIWKKRKNREAVSPVIATILMVAITVVLAAVLYVMVMGFGTTGAQTPTGSFVGTPTNQTTGFRLQCGVLSPTTTWTSCKLTMTVGTVTSTPVLINLASGTAQATVLIGVVGTNYYKVVITDLAADGKISTGDSALVQSFIPAGTTGVAFATGSYTLTLLFTSTGGQITAQSWTV